MNKAHLLLLFSLALITIGSNDGLACSCVLPLPAIPLEQQVREARKQANAVFVGNVLAVNEDQDKFVMVVKFQIERSWKQIRAQEIVITTGRGHGDCGFPFTVGMKYLVYAYSADDGKFSTGICSRTKKVSENETQEIKLLGRELKLHTRKK